MQINKTYVIGLKIAVMIAVVIFFVIALIGYFYGSPAADNNGFEFLKVKLSDANIGHAVGLIFLCYGLFGK